MRGFTTTKLKNIISLEHCVVRFVMAWCFICIIQTITINSMNIAINKLEYVKLVNMPVMYACIIILITVDYILCRICRNKWSDTYEKKIYCCYSRSSSFVYMLCQLLYGDKIFIIWLT